MSFCQKCDSLSQKTRNHRSIALAGHGRFQIGYCAGLVRSVSQCQFSGLSESGIIVQPQDFLRCCLFRSHWMLGMSDSDGNTMPRRYFTWGSLHEYLPLCGVIENYVFWMILSSTNRLCIIAIIIKLTEIQDAWGMRIEVKSNFTVAKLRGANSESSLSLISQDS